MQRQAVFDDPTRLCPMPAGPALLEGSRWTVRLVRGDASIEAPRALLECVARACDGTLSITDILQATRPASLRPKVAALIDDLLRAGVLIDGNLFMAASQRFAWLPIPLGQSADKSVWRDVPLRFSLAPPEEADAFGPAVTTPLDELIEQRRSVRTYDDSQPFSADALRAYLWLLSGVLKTQPEAADVSAIPPRRTIPSGGAVHALRPMLVLQRRVGDWAPGVYAVSYPAARRVQLTRVHDDAAWLPRAVVHPWYLSFSTGIVFLVADPRWGAVKYKARALQYTFIEAGAAFQNAAVAAPALGVAMSMYGGYVESVSAEGLGLEPHDIVISAAIFGVAPTPEQERLASESPHMDFQWADEASPTYSVPYHVGRIRTERGGELQAVETWGRDRDPRLAFVKTAVESIERLGFRSPQHVSLARFSDWDHVLDPRLVLRYAEVQYRSPGFAFKPFDESAVCGWVPGRSLASGRELKLLAEHVYNSAALKSMVPGAWGGFGSANSSGCAAHTDPQQALDRALLELIERDAYMRSWLTQQPGVGLSLRLLPADLQRRIKSLEAVGCRVSLQQLPSPWAPVCVVYAQHEARHFTVVGASARPTLVEAAAGSMEEMETLAYMNLNEPRPQRLHPRQVSTPGDHTFLYASPRYFRRADALIQPPRSMGIAKASRLADLNGPLLQRLLDAGREVAVVDIAVPGSAIDQGRTPVTVLRAFVPGLLPMSFGYSKEPLGLLQSYDRRGRFPHPFP